MFSVAVQVLGIEGTLFLYQITETKDLTVMQTFAEFK
jgi:hypothetical protein